MTALDSLAWLCIGGYVACAFLYAASFDGWLLRAVVLLCWAAVAALLFLASYATRGLT